MAVREQAPNERTKSPDELAAEKIEAAVKDNAADHLRADRKSKHSPFFPGLGRGQRAAARPKSTGNVRCRPPGSETIKEAPGEDCRGLPQLVCRCLPHPAIARQQEVRTPVAYQQENALSRWLPLV